MIMTGMESQNSIVRETSFEILYGITEYLDRSEKELKIFGEDKQEHFMKFIKLWNQELLAQAIECILKPLLSKKFTNMGMIVE